MKVIRKLTSSMSLNVIGAMILMLFVFGVVVSAIGYYSFTDSYKREYAETTYHMADTATTLVNGDHIDDYLRGGEMEEYERISKYLNSYCHKIHASLLYVIKVDQADYGSFTSIFNLCDNEVDNTDYTPWELGFQRETTNDEYRVIYHAIYEEGSLYETIYRFDGLNGQHPHITTLVPVHNSDGDVVAILCMQRPMRVVTQARRGFLARIAILTLLVSVIGSVFATVFIRRQVIHPVRKAAKEASRFSEEKTKGEPLGELSKYQDILKLAVSIDAMETDMVEYMNNLTTITADKERIVAELNFARDIQANSIPNDFPAFPDRKEFDIYASMDPAKEVGGDFYNFFLVDDDHLALVIGDVSGKGIPAALFMMVTNILITMRTRMGGTPAEVLEFVNNELCEHNEAEMFCTLWMGILEISTGKVIEVNAGHENPVIYRKGIGYEERKTKHNIALATMPGIKYKNHEFELGVGDKIFVYTDGVPEATDANNHMYTMERLVDRLNGIKDYKMKETLERVHQSVNTFVGSAPQFDDLTMLGLEYLGK